MKKKEVGNIFVDNLEMSAISRIRLVLHFILAIHLIIIDNAYFFICTP